MYTCRLHDQSTARCLGLNPTRNKVWSVVVSWHSGFLNHHVHDLITILVGCSIKPYIKHSFKQLISYFNKKNLKEITQSKTLTIGFTAIFWHLYEKLWKTFIGHICVVMSIFYNKRKCNSISKAGKCSTMCSDVSCGN